MKRINILLVFFVLIYACKEQNKETVVEANKNIAADFSSFGAEIDTNASLSTLEMTTTYKNITGADTLTTKFSATVAEVCQTKGCWMKLKLEDGSEAIVKFKDYDFFMPKDISGKEVMVNGLAFIEEMSVEEQQHYAMDGGESEEVIAAITQPKITYRFEADGVLLKQ